MRCEWNPKIHSCMCEYCTRTSSPLTQIGESDISTDSNAAERGKGSKTDFAKDSAVAVKR